MKVEQEAGDPLDVLVCGLPDDFLADFVAFLEVRETLDQL